MEQNSHSIGIRTTHYNEETHSVRFYKSFAVDLLRRLEQSGDQYVEVFFTKLPLAIPGKFSHSVHHDKKKKPAL